MDSPADTLRPTRAPSALQWLAVAAALSVLLLVGLPVWMLLDRDATMATIMRDRPDLSPAHRRFAFAAVVGYAATLHAVDVVLVVWLTIKTLHGRQWARIALSGCLVVASLLGLRSATAGTPYLVLVVATDLIHLIMLGLLWLPVSARAFFGARRGPNRARNEGDGQCSAVLRSQRSVE